MILRYTIRDFYSFRDEVVVDFTVGAQAGSRPGLLEAADGTRINSILGILGPNASGKTNLLKPLGFLSWFLLESARAKPGSDIIFEPFLFDSSVVDRPSELKIEFEFKGHVYRYELEMTMHRVIREALFRKRTRFSFLFKRVWDDSIKAYHFKSQDIGPSAHVPQRENASWVSSALLQGHDLALQFQPFFESLVGNLGPDGRLPHLDPETGNVLFAANFYHESPALLKKASSLLSEFDLGLSALRLHRDKVVGADGKERDVTIPLAIHKIGGKEHVLALMNESRGTQALFVMLRYLLPVLESGGIAFIDEFESGLHPHMVRSILELFFNPVTNPNKAQLIATFHTDFLLRDTLHKYQIYLVEKDETLNSQAYRLDGVRGVRNVDNLYEKYHAGAYGGVPSLQ